MTPSSGYISTIEHFYANRSMDDDRPFDRMHELALQQH